MVIKNCIVDFLKDNLNFKMSCREILTLQFGHYSNYVGTHWWNLQELGFEYNTDKPSEINHNVLYREGLTNNGNVTFTPRLLLVDLKGSLKSLPQEGTLYNTAIDPSKLEVDWIQPPEVKAEPRVEKNEYQHLLDENKEPQPEYNIENDIQVWSDFLFTRYHPRTINVINTYEYENKETAFDIFPLGRNLWKDENFEEDFVDKIRNYIEECDSFQGFQILLDSTDSYGGLSAACMDYLQDEYESKSVFALPLIPSKHGNEFTLEDSAKYKLYESNRILNLAMCYSSLVEYSSLFVPLAVSKDAWRNLGAPRRFNHVNYNSESMYHTSAILASAIDTFTLRYRQRHTPYCLIDLSVDLTSNGRKSVAASLCIPFSLNEGSDLIDCLDNWDGPLSQSITPGCEIGTSRMMQLIGFRGVSESRLKRPLSQADKQKDMPAYRCNSISEMMEMYYSYTCHASATSVTNIEKGITVKRPYPNIFDGKIGIDGSICGKLRPENIGVETVPVLSGLHSGNEIGGMLESLNVEVKRLKYPRFHNYITAGFENDEYSEMIEKLLTFRECYEDNYYL